SEEGVGAERQGASVGSRRLGKHGLLQGEKGADLSRPDGHVTDDARERRSPPAGGGKEQASRDRVGEGEEDQRLPPTNSVREEADADRVDRAAEDGQRQHDSDEDWAQSQLSRVEAVDDSEKPVRDGTD